MRALITKMFVLAVSAALLSCGGTVPFNEEQIRNSIGKVNAEYSKAIREGNMADILAAYTDDATMVPPDGGLIKGKQAIEEYYRTLLQMGMKDITLTTIEVDGGGDVVYEIGKTRVLIQPEGLHAIQDSTKYLVIWKRQVDGAWKVHADIWNLASR